MPDPGWCPELALDVIQGQALLWCALAGLVAGGGHPALTFSVDMRAGSKYSLRVQ